MDSLLFFIDKYGYLVLFTVVFLEMLALPISGQATMAYCGFLSWQGKLSWTSCILIAGSAAALGMTLAYGLGRVYGLPFVQKYGRLVHFGPKQLDQTDKLMNRYGDSTLILAYYIPGFRHFTGYFSGITQFPAKRFVLFSYSGALIWVIIFVSIGRGLGEEWKSLYPLIEKYFFLAGSLLVVVFVVYLLLHKNKALGRE